MSQRTQSLLPWLILCTSLGIITLIYLSLSLQVNKHLLMPLDDTYIHFQYARQMANAEPYQYNSGDSPTSGATSLLYIPLLAIGYLLGFKGLSLGFWAVMLGTLAHLGSSWLIYQLLITPLTSPPSPLSKDEGGSGGRSPLKGEGGSDKEPLAREEQVKPLSKGEKESATKPLSNGEGGSGGRSSANGERKSDIKPLSPWTRLSRVGVRSIRFDAIALTLTLSYALSGAFLWAALSGMETALFVFITLLTLTFFQREDFPKSVIAAALAALIRPEGAVIALTTPLAIFWRTRQKNGWLLLPTTAVLLQPILNFLLTGSGTASGTVAKSHLYNLTIPFSERLTTIFGEWLRMWREFATGQSDVDGWYLVPLLTIPALLAMLLSLRTSLRQRSISTGLLAVIWMILLSAAIATLDTAFWHYKRYQLPIMALMFPLAGWLILQIRDRVGFGEQWTFRLYALAILGFSLYTAGVFAIRYRDNVWVVEHQQMAMARWVKANLPEDARLAVHDVGVMRYVGERDTYDVVGLTTPDAASAWRQGAGTIYETMANHEYRPDYFAIYPDVQSLPFLVEAGVFGAELARFEIPLPAHSVASASGIQIVAPIIWSESLEDNLPQMTAIQRYVVGATGVHSLDVGNLADEESNEYSWFNESTPTGFASDLRNFSYVTCEDCTVLDSTRVITGGERFNLNMDDAGWVILRVHAASPATLTAGCDDESRQVRVVPATPGHWVDIPFVIEDGAERFCIASDTVYYPAHYWIYEGEYAPLAPSGSPAIATFADPFVTDFTFFLINFELQIHDSNLSLNFAFQSNGDIQHDGKFFIHLYDDVNAPPVLQQDVYVGGGMPPANWLPGVIEDQANLSLADLPAGTYTLAIGFYDPVSGSRYPVSSAVYEGDGGRLFVREIGLP